MKKEDLLAVVVERGEREDADVLGQVLTMGSALHVLGASDAEIAAAFRRPVRATVLADAAGPVAMVLSSRAAVHVVPLPRDSLQAQEIPMAKSPAESAPKLDAAAQAESADTEKKIDAALDKRTGPEVVFYFGLGPEGTAPEFILSPISYAAFLDVVAKFRGAGWHAYPDFKLGVLKLVQP